MKLVGFILVFIPLTLFSQEKLKPKYVLGISLAPEINFLWVDKKNSQQGQSRPGWSGSLNLKYPLNKVISMRSALGYGFKRFNYNYSYLIGYYQRTKEISFSEVELPVLIQLDLKDQISFFATGLELVYCFKNFSKNSMNDAYGISEELPDTKYKAIFNITYVFSFGYNIKFPKRNSLSLEPMAKVYIRDHLITHTRLWNIGLKSTYYFGK